MTQGNRLPDPRITKACDDLLGCALQTDMTLSSGKCRTRSRHPLTLPTRRSFTQPCISFILHANPSPIVNFARFGLSGFADPHLRRALYTPNAPPSDYLRQYGERFDLYEVAPSADPGFSRAHAEGLLDQSPAHLRLLPRLPNGVSPREVDSWSERLAPILRNHRCGPIQLAWPGAWSSTEEQNLQDAIERLYQHLPASGRIAVEFLHGTWLRPSAMRLLEEHEAALTWSTRSGNVPHKVTADFINIRLTGTHHRRCRDEVVSFLERVRARHGEQKPMYAISTRSSEAYGLHAIERFARGLGKPLRLGPAPQPGQSGLDRFKIYA